MSAAAHWPAQPAEPTLPVAGTLDNGDAIGGELSGLSTTVLDGVLMLVATLTGPTLPSAGTPIHAPIRQLSATDNCTTLTLALGPSRLEVLDSTIDWVALQLDVSAVPRSGNLRGNPLCAGLDGGGSGQEVTALLNRLLTGLGF